MLVSSPESPRETPKLLITSPVKVKLLLMPSIGELLELLTQLRTKVTVVHAGVSLLSHQPKVESSKQLVPSQDLLNKNLLTVPIMVLILTKDVTVVGKILVSNTLLITESPLGLHTHIPLRTVFVRRTFNQDTLLVQLFMLHQRRKLHSLLLLLLFQLLLLLTVVTDSSNSIPVVSSVNNVLQLLTMLSLLLVMVLKEQLHSTLLETLGVPHGVNKVTSE